MKKLYYDTDGRNDLAIIMSRAQEVTVYRKLDMDILNVDGSEFEVSLNMKLYLEHRVLAREDLVRC